MSNDVSIKAEITPVAGSLTAVHVQAPKSEPTVESLDARVAVIEAFLRKRSSDFPR